MSADTATRILEAWIRLESALRRALPVCSVQPPTQPSELLSALRINGILGPEEEARVASLRGIRNRVAHEPGEPSQEDAAAFEAEVGVLTAILDTTGEERC